MVRQHTVNVPMRRFDSCPPSHPNLKIMTSAELKEKWLAFVRGMNERGFPIPTIRDPATKVGSMSLTLVFISFNFCLLAMIGKAAGFLGGIDPSQALNLFMVCAGLYWGRKFQRDSSGGATLDTAASAAAPAAEPEKSKEEPQVPG